MQATHYCTGPGVPRDAATFVRHVQFAEEALGEKVRLQPEDYDDVSTISRGLHHNLKRRHWMAAVWILEIVWIFFLFLACVMEMWAACPLDIGLSLACWHCYSGSFLAWGMTFCVVWSLHLYLTVLLVSRGFSMGLFGAKEGTAFGRPPPRGGSLAYVCGLLLLLLLIFVEIGVLFSSRSCIFAGGIYQNHPRSSLLLGVESATVAVAPILLALGRLWV